MPLFSVGASCCLVDLSLLPLSLYYLHDEYTLAGGRGRHSHTATDTYTHTHFHIHVLNSVGPHNTHAGDVGPVSLPAVLMLVLVLSAVVEELDAAEVLVVSSLSLLLLPVRTAAPVGAEGMAWLPLVLVLLLILLLLV